VAVAGTLLFAGTIANDFVYDDINIAARNPAAQDPADLGAIFGSHYWSHVEEGGNLYRPLTIWSFALNHRLGEGGAAGYHAVNAALHGLTGGLLVLVAAALGLGSGGAFAAGLIFVFHPVHVEAVAPVVGRSELLAALFVLGAWLCHLSAPRAAAGRAWILGGGAALLFGAGLLSKEHAAVLPALILAGDLVGTGGLRWRPVLRTLLPMALVGGAILAVRLSLLPGLGADDPLGSVFAGIDPMTRIMTATGVLGRYLWLLIFPAALSADYSYHQIPLITSPLAPLFLISALLHAALLAAGIVLLRRGRISGLAIMAYLLAIFPVSNLAFSVGTVMGERLLYLPSAGFCILLPALYAGIAGRRSSRSLHRATAAGLAVLCALYGARVLARNLDWKDQHTLFSATVLTSPRSAKAWYNLGVAEDDRGNPSSAIDAYRRAVEIRPDMSEGHRNLGLDLLGAGMTAEALPHLERAASLDPAIPDIFGDIGIAYARLGRTGEAVAALKEETARRPESYAGWYNLGTILLESGRSTQAVAALETAAGLAPAEADVLIQLGVALTAVGRLGDALDALASGQAAGGNADEALHALAVAAEAAGDAGLAARARSLAGGPRADPGEAGHGVGQRRATLRASIARVPA
jgi:tetratricopeptide (TPR) repeat protein